MGLSMDENKNSHRKITMTHSQTTYINRIALRAGKKWARSAEVGALASVFEKSATELKQEKLLKCKQTIQIATFNVRTLNRIGQLPELTALAVEHKIDIIWIQEHRYTHTEDIKYHKTGNGWTLATVSVWKNSVNATVGGVGILIELRALKTLNSIERIQPRMTTATFNGNPRATIISCYSPTSVSEETELVAFCDELSSLVRSIPKHNLLVIGGDMNAQIAKNGNNKYSLHKIWETLHYFRKIFVCIYIYIYIERERERQTDRVIYIYIYIYRERETDRQTELYIYIYIERERETDRQTELYIYIYIERERETDRQTELYIYIYTHTKIFLK